MRYRLTVTYNTTQHGGQVELLQMLTPARGALFVVPAAERLSGSAGTGVEKSRDVAPQRNTRSSA